MSKHVDGPGLKVVTISERCWNSRQSWHYQHTFRHAATKLRTTIQRNAYDFQSSAKVERWDGSRWFEVVSAPIEALPCAAISYVHKGVTCADFSPSALILEDEAREIA